MEALDIASISAKAWHVFSDNGLGRESIGMLLTVIGASGAAFGTILSRKALLIASRGKSQVQTYAFRSKLWYLAQLFYIGGNVVHFFALNFAPASLLAPLNATGLAANALLCRLILKETLTLNTAISTLGVMVGVILTALSSKLHSHDNLDHAQIGLECWMRLDFVIFFVLTVMLALGSFLAMQWYENRADAEHMFEMLTPKSTMNRPLIEMSVDHDSEFHLELPPWVGMTYGLAAGLIGCFTVLTLKDLLALVSESNPQSDPRFWLSGLMGITSVFLQNHLLNMGLIRNEAVTVIPCYFVTWITSSIIGGMVKFHEFNPLSPAGVLILISALITLISLLPLVIEAITSQTETALTVVERAKPSEKKKLTGQLISIPVGSWIYVTIGGMLRDKSWRFYSPKVYLQMTRMRILAVPNRRFTLPRLSGDEAASLLLRKSMVGMT